MELMDAILGRCSVRDYRSDPVLQETITRLIEAAIHAPSAINQQPWSFSVVRDRPLLDRVSRDAKAHMLNARPVILPAHLYESLANPEFHVFYHAPVLIVISAIERGPWIAEDCALAAENSHARRSRHGAWFLLDWIGASLARYAEWQGSAWHSCFSRCRRSDHRGRSKVHPTVGSSKGSRGPLDRLATFGPGDRRGGVSFREPTLSRGQFVASGSSIARREIIVTLPRCWIPRTVADGVDEKTCARPNSDWLKRNSMSCPRHK